MFLPSWRTSELSDGGVQTVINLGLPFSPWFTGVKTWASAEVDGAWDGSMNAGIVFLSWSWLLPVLSTVLGSLRKRIKDGGNNYEEPRDHE